MIAMTDEEKIKAHCLAEVSAKQRWAENVTDGWRASASVTSIRMVEESVRIPLTDQAERLFRYWKYRFNLGFDANARRQWYAVLAGSPIDGNYSYFQTHYPEPKTEYAIRPS
jgi:hypothetical protein